jgi:hypothetical protein
MSSNASNGFCGYRHACGRGTAISVNLDFLHSHLFAFTSASKNRFSRRYSITGCATEER